MTEQTLKVGDIIVGNEDGRGKYGITTIELNFVGEVIDTCNDREIQVRVLECDDKDCIGDDFYVEAKHFELQTKKEGTTPKIFIFRKKTELKEIKN